MTAFFDTHRALLDRALDTALAGGDTRAFTDSPAAGDIGVEALGRGRRAFEARLGRSFVIGDGERATKRVGDEASPYGFALGVTYPTAPVDAWLEAAHGAGRSWARWSIESRTGIALEALARLNQQSFEMAHAVMHTTGQPLTMAFQAGGPHAQDRALEAVALAYSAMKRVPSRAPRSRDASPQDGGAVARSWHVVPAGIALVVGSPNAPNWSAYPGLFASLVTGNTVLVKPHNEVVLPLAITVATVRAVLAEAGADPEVVQLCVDNDAWGSTRELAVHPAVKIIDNASRLAETNWLIKHATQARLFHERQGINPVVVDSTDDFAGMRRRLAYLLTLYGGQTLTAPQNIFIPADGIDTDEGHKRFDDIALALADAIDELVAEPVRAARILGALQSAETVDRITRCQALGRIVREARSVPVADYDKARTLGPLLVATEAGREELYATHRFGPIAFLISTIDTAESIERAAHGARVKGAVTASVYSTNDHVIEAAADAFTAAGVSLTCNLTANAVIDLSEAAHMDASHEDHGCAPLAADFVTARFRVTEVRRPR